MDLPELEAGLTVAVSSGMQFFRRRTNNSLVAVATACLSLVLACGGGEAGDDDVGDSVDAGDFGDALVGVGAPHVLYNPTGDDTTYLIDLNGDVVHSWDCDAPVANNVYLLENGNLLRPASASNPDINGGAAGGIVQEIAWGGTVLWEFVYNSSTVRLHHDVEKLPNGNVLMVAWEVKSAAEASAAGSSEGREMWPDHIIEVEPSYPSGGDIVWEWHSWDHLVQDVDAAKPNYGNVAASPGKIDINAGNSTFYAPPGAGGDWLHINSVAYNEALDQVILSSHFMSELYVIDHDTTTAEAAGPAGDILYRWGNPQIYDGGDSGDQVFYVVHHVTWIPAGLPGAGNIMAFNNGDRRDGSSSYSSIDEITPPLAGDGSYALDGDAYGPSALTWTYQDPSSFYANHISSAQRLPSGNTFICEGTSGHFFEVTSAGEVVWEHTVSGEVARAYRYEGDYPGLGALQ